MLITCLPLASSDHDSLSFKILTHENVQNPGETPLMTRNFRKADYVGIEQFLSLVSWPDVFNYCVDVNDFYTTFLNVLNKAIENFVPLNQSKPRTKKFSYAILHEQRENPVAKS